MNVSKMVGSEQFKKEFDLERNVLNAILQVGNRNEINKITLFGSRARGDNKKTSDIDLAVYCDARTNSESKIFFELEDIETLYKFDIVFIKNDTDKKLLENIEREGIIIYERI